jgi:hypothetical protein
MSYECVFASIARGMKKTAFAATGTREFPPAYGSRFAVLSEHIRGKEYRRLNRGCQINGRLERPGDYSGDFVGTIPGITLEKNGSTA